MTPIDRSCFSPRIGRSRSLQSSVTGLHRVIGVLLNVVKRPRQDLVEHGRIVPGSIGHHLGRRSPGRLHRRRKEPPGGKGISAGRDQHVDNWPNWSTARYKAEAQPERHRDRRPRPAGGKLADTALGSVPRFVNPSPSPPNPVEPAPAPLRLFRYSPAITCVCPRNIRAVDRA
jgi:hypothetical protein